SSGWRPPRICVTDWGQDYRTKGLFEPLELCGRNYAIALALGIQHRKSRPYNGREKPVERDFREVCDIVHRDMPGYLGNSPVARTHEAAAILAQPERLPTLEEATEALETRLARYHERRSAARITTENRAPIEAWL